jgi:hypothetical protein
MLFLVDNAALVTAPKKGPSAGTGVGLRFLINAYLLGTGEHGVVVVNHSSKGADSKVHFAGRTSAKCLLLWYFLGGARKYR